MTEEEIAEIYELFDILTEDLKAIDKKRQVLLERLPKYAVYDSRGRVQCEAMVWNPDARKKLKGTVWCDPATAEGVVLFRGIREAKTWVNWLNSNNYNVTFKEYT